MRKVFLLVAIVCCFLVSRSQNQDDNGNLIYPSTFSLSTPLNNGKISFFEDKVSVAGSLGFTVIDMYKPYVEEIRTHIAVFGGFHPETGEPYLVWSTGGPTFTRSDFTVDGHVYNHSDTKDFSVEIPFSHDFESGDRLAVFYKYYFNKAVNLPNFELSGWAPLVTHGKEWFVSNTKQYGFVKVYPPASFSGPEHICDEGVYTITNPGTISLQSASGIATLTSLGSNQWKVERVGSASGQISISSSVPGQIYRKLITVGDAQFTETQMDGPSIAIWGQEHSIEIIPPTGLSSSELEVGLENNLGRAQLVKVDKFNYKLKVHMQESRPDLPPYGPDFIIRARFTNVCGNYEYKRFNIKAANSATPGPGGIE